MKSGTHSDTCFRRCRAPLSCRFFYSEVYWLSKNIVSIKVDDRSIDNCLASDRRWISCAVGTDPDSDDRVSSAAGAVCLRTLRAVEYKSIQALVSPQSAEIC